ncbi:glycosyltransferase family 4 protein [Collinsella sp. BA40]|uniref:glycosyltransferase family 4 protein n=1 Tax=Collinsella sp. BA40 TaxID=2560852 RepID=UPI0011CB1187|nr:glycosyltransferase family 4 protein [Collinsella sp. BA40]TXF37539.1 glycosyltransferase family 4 protein [Collinsella sp. BA40]
MKILVSCQHYWPEPFNTSDVCEELVRRGHEVAVITGMPNTGMAGNDIPSEYRGRRRFEEERNGVRIIRVPLHPRKTGAVHRVLNYLSFWHNGNKAARSLHEEFDVVLGYQFSPVMQVDPGITYAKKHGIKNLLYSFDLWPASLLAGGFTEDSLPFKWMRSVSKRIYCDADRLAVTSPLFDEYFRDELGLDIPDSAYLPQYADSAFLNAAEPVSEGFESGKVHLTFAGNIGRAQSVETIVEAAALMPKESKVVFHIVGSGSSLEGCEARADELGLDNIVFHGRKPVEEMPSYYAASDAMLVTFADSPMATYTLPRKVTTYLAAGKPVLAALSGETKRVLDRAGCGMACNIEDPDGLARICCEFERAENKAEMGSAARTYYMENYTQQQFFCRLEDLLLELTKG